MNRSSIRFAPLLLLATLVGCGSIDESEPKPRLEATAPAGTAYGDTLLDTSKQLTFELRNSDTGLAKVKTLENIVPTISGTGLSMTHDCPASLKEGESCPITVRYAPTLAGTLAGTLRVTSNAETVSLTLSGVAERPLDPARGVLDFTGTTDGDFGSVRIGDMVTRTYTVRNVGNAVDTITVDLPSGSGWTASNGCGDSLAEGASCAVNVTFTPTESNTSVPSPLIISDAYNSNYGALTISLKGTGN